MILALSFKKQVYKYLPILLLAFYSFMARAQTNDTTAITRSKSSLQDTGMIRLNIHIPQKQNITITTPCIARRRR
jgi:hypothetical protein